MHMFTNSYVHTHKHAYMRVHMHVCVRAPWHLVVHPYLFFRFSLPCQVLSDCESWAGSRLRVWDAKDIALHVTTARDLLHTCAQGTHVSTPLRNFITQWRQNRASANQKQKRQERHQTSSCSWFHISFRSTCWRFGQLFCQYTFRSSGNRVPFFVKATVSIQQKDPARNTQTTASCLTFLFDWGWAGLGYV